VKKRKNECFKGNEIELVIHGHTSSRFSQVLWAEKSIEVFEQIGLQADLSMVDDRPCFDKDEIAGLVTA